MPETPTPLPDVETLAADLRRLLRSGLPASPSSGQALLDLPGVRARAVDPTQQTSRAQALDGLLRWLLARFEHRDLAEPARLLFGATRATAGTTLTYRRAAAAATADYEVHHFRKRIEPKVCDLLALQLLADSEGFADTRATAPALAPARGRPLRLPADVFAWEVAEHEEWLSRLWSAVYALRAELLALARLASMQADSADVEDAADAALWRYAQLLAAAATYRSAYGGVLLHGEGAMPPERLAHLAGWLPELPDADLDTLIAIGQQQGDGTALAGYGDLLARWRAALIEAATK